MNEKYFRANGQVHLDYILFAQNYLHQHTDAAFEKLKNIN
jgi:hypothetical protein